MVWHGTPSNIFPVGEHTFPADLEALTALLAAHRADLEETHLVPVSKLLRDERRPDQASPPGITSSEEISCEVLPLRLTHLRRFVDAHGARLAEALGDERVTANTLAHGARRVAFVRALNAPDVIVDHEAAELARVAAAGWKPEVDPYASVPDVLETASIVDVDARTRSGTPLTPDADIADLVLLALQCCLLPDVSSIDAPWIEHLSWVPFPARAADDDAHAIADAVVRVRPAICSEHVDELSFADVRAFPEAASLGPGGALLRVCMAADDEDG